jgi:hypothetical protein
MRIKGSIGLASDIIKTYLSSYGLHNQIVDIVFLVTFQISKVILSCNYPKLSG